MLARTIKAVLAGAAMSATVCGVAWGGSLTLTNTFGLNNQLADPHSNFHPQGLGYDTGSNELLFMQQSLQAIVRTDLSGNITGTRAVPYNHTTSVAGDGTNYYFSDYTGNSGGLDLFSIGKAAGSATAISAETAAYGGYPIDVRDGTLYRTNIINNTYNWSGLNQIRISSIATPDAGIQTVTLATGAGMGDIAVDSANNNVWVIDYAASASLRLFDLATGAEIQSFALGLDGLDAGITYANDTLYYYDWNSGSGSTLSVFAVSGFSAVPEPGTVAVLGLGFVVLGLSRRQRRR